MFLKGLLKEHECDAILITDLKTIRYLCGFGGINAVLIYTEKEMILITDPRFELEAKNDVKNARIVINEDESNLWDMPALYEEYGIKRIGFFSQNMTVFVYNNLSKNLNLIPINTMSSSCRYIKRDDEMRNIKESIRIQEKSFEEVLEKLTEQPTEKMLAAYLDSRMRLNGSEKNPFNTIIAFAEDSALVHARPSDKKIAGSGFLIMDFGAEYNGYCSDQTMTLILGEPTKEMIDIYDAVYTAQKRAIAAVRPGVTAVALYNTAYGYLKEKGYEKYIQHALGHHIGLDIHEYPKIFPFTDFEFKEGMVFTIEPGLYVPDLGGVRLEDMVLVTSNGHEVLTSLPKEKKIII